MIGFKNGVQKLLWKDCLKENFVIVVYPMFMILVPGRTSVRPL